MVEYAHHCHGYVLTGGRSSRMNQDKAVLPFGNRPLAVWIAERVKPVCGNVSLVGGGAKYSVLGFPVVEDILQDQGPLGGIHAALADSPAAFNLIVGCDMPYLSTEFLESLVEIARTAGADAVVPESEAFGLEPLCAVYTRDCLPPLEDALRNGQRKISRFLERLHLRLVSREEWQPYNRNGNLFRNLNTLEDYQEAIAALMGEKQESGVSLGPARAVGYRESE
jgi:molybdopterin-guanine dinucleotide biosynthesis protein A